jgi:hypothetical protein
MHGEFIWEGVPLGNSREELMVHTLIKQTYGYPGGYDRDESIYREWVPIFSTNCD